MTPTDRAQRDTAAPGSQLQTAPSHRGKNEGRGARNESRICSSLLHGASKCAQYLSRHPTTASTGVELLALLAICVAFA